MKQNSFQTPLALWGLPVKNRAQARRSVFNRSRALTIPLAFLLLLCFSCQKQTRAFKDIEVQGRLVNFYTKEPIPHVEVRLRANNVHSASSYAEAAILLDSYTTGPDGSFVLKSKASKKDQYQIQIDTDYHIYANAVDTMFDSKPNQVVYLGDLFFGQHTYWCRIRFRPVSGSCAWVYDQNQQLVRINAGTDTTVRFSTPISYYTLRQYKNTFPYVYKTGSCTNAGLATLMNLNMQISAADTMSFQIDY